MCKNKNCGGRCATETRKTFSAKLNDVSNGPVSLSVLAELLTAATEHAGTKSGHNEVMLAASNASNATVGALLADAAKKGALASLDRSDQKYQVETLCKQGELVTARGWILSGHLREQAESKGISEDDLVSAVDEPSTVYESYRYPGQLKHIRNGICVAVDPKKKTAITVFLDRVETELRSDQRKDKDALAHERKRSSSEVPTPNMLRRPVAR